MKLVYNFLNIIYILYLLISLSSQKVIIYKMFFIISKKKAFIARKKTLTPYSRSFIYSISKKIKEYL